MVHANTRAAPEFANMVKSLAWRKVIANVQSTEGSQNTQMLAAFVLLLWVLTCAVIATWVARRTNKRTVAFWCAPVGALMLVLLPVADEVIALPSYLAMCHRAGFNLVIDESKA
jgi:hypothetical protein